MDGVVTEGRLDDPTVRVLLFASARTAAGADELSVSLVPGATAEDVVTAACDTAPGLSGLRDTLLVAVDERYVPRTAAVPSGAVVALFPPVSGG